MATTDREQSVKQECIPVGCVLPTLDQFFFWGGGVLGR